MNTTTYIHKACGNEALTVQFEAAVFPRYEVEPIKGDGYRCASCGRIMDDLNSEIVEARYQ